MRSNPLHRRGLFSFAAYGFAILLFAGIRTGSVGAAPQINSLSLRGLQIGRPTTLVIEGDDLLPEPRVMLDPAAGKQTLRPNATAKKIEIEIEPSDKAPAGLHLLRVVTADGVSNGLPIGVDSLAQLPLTDKIETLPVALSGRVTGDQVARTSFTGKRGQTVIVEVEARRLLSELNPVIRLYDSRRVQLAWAQSNRALQGDARLQVVLPSDGEYSVELHDALYQGRGQGAFRLKIGEWTFADIVFPPALQRGAVGTMSFLSTNIPSGQAAVPMTTPPGTTHAPAPWPDGIDNFSGPRPVVLISELKEANEGLIPNEPLPEHTAPIGISGILQENSTIKNGFREARFRIAVLPGAKLRIEVQAQSLGSPMDAVLNLYDESGKQTLMTNDDRPGMSDSVLDYVVPPNVKVIVVGVKDLLGRTGRDFVYRVVISAQEPSGFSLSIADDRIAVPQSGVGVLRITAARNGYQGPIDLTFAGLPNGVTATNTRIEAGNTIGLVMLSAEPGALSYGIVKAFGSAASEGPATSNAASPNTATESAASALVRPVLLAGDALSNRQPWLRQEIALAVTRPSPIGLAWNNADAELPLGAKWAIQPIVTRAESKAENDSTGAGSNGVVRLSLLSNQQPPKKTIKENNKDKQIDDVDRSIRLDGSAMIAADKTEGAAKIIVPADLPEQTYQLVLRGELLSADGKQVLATTYTPVLSVKPTRPVRLELAGNTKLDARAGTGETGKLIGKIVRQPGFDAPVRVTLTGLAKGVPAPIEDIAADQTDFELTVRFPFGTKPGALKDVKVYAIAGTNVSDTNAVRTNSVAVSINVVAGKKPAVEKPLAVFEDEIEFAESLNEGGGQATLETAEKYSGTSSLRVTPDQKFNAMLAGLGVKIRKEPGAGEYRYLRFAWKKKGGQQLCLQLNHDGQWGPSPENSAVKFRYHAGPGECFGASLAVDPNAPDKLTIVTRDLYADFGEFTLNGLAFAPIDGEFALFDHLYLGRSIEDLDTAKPDGK